MNEAVKLCMGCMNPLGDDGICSICGYNNNTPYNPKYLSPGTILVNRYLVGRVYSFNGEGAAYIAYDKLKDEKIFIKEFMPDALCERVIGSSIISVKGASIVQYKSYMSEFIDLNRKLLKMKTLTHINSVIEIFEVNNTAYAVLEYIDGITLKHFLQDNAGELTWEQVRKLFPPIFTTLSLVHNAGLVHRGIGLDTIYYTQKGEMKLTGFAVAATRTVNTDLSAYLFTGYAAPEQYSVRKWQGTWTDVYAICALLYRMLTGCMPTDSSERLSDDKLLSPHSINPNIPKNVSAVIMEGMCLNSELRIQTVTELVTRLFADCAQEDVKAQAACNKGAEAAIELKPRVVAAASVKPVIKTEAKPRFAAAFLNFDNAKTTVLIGSALLLSILIVLFVVLKLLFGSPEASQVTRTAQFTNSNYDASAFEEDEIPAATQDSSEEETQVTSDESVADNSFSSAVPTTLMPELTGGTYQGVVNNEELKKWIVLVTEQEYNEDYESGVIFYQDVPVGTTISAGQIVNIKVSKGSSYAIIPDYHGMLMKDYLSELDLLNIKYDTQVMESDEVMDGYVVKTSKPIGDRIDLIENEILIVYIAENSNRPND